VLTKTLTGIASEAGILGGAGSKLGRRGIAVTAMLAGALIGAVLVLHVSVAADIALALALVLLVALAAHLASRSDAPWMRP
jgi:hypothetical protein